MYAYVYVYVNVYVYMYMYLYLYVYGYVYLYVYVYVYVYLYVYVYVCAVMSCGVCLIKHLTMHPITRHMFGFTLELFAVRPESMFAHS